MIRLHRIDHVRLRVADLGEAVPRWCEQFGLVLRSHEDGLARLACDDEPYCLELSTVDEGVPAWWVMPVAVIALLFGSLRRAVRQSSDSRGGTA